MRWWLVLGLVWATGCGAAKKSSYEPSASYKMADHEGRFGGAASNENTYMLDDMMPAPAPPPMEVMDDDGMADVMLAAPEAEAAPSTPSEPPDDGPARMVFYDGWAQVRTPRAEELVDEVVSLVESVDGYVESRGLDRVSARVPVERFDEVWAQVLAMGPVERRHLGADDVTDAFADLSLRLKSLEATRERLAELLAKATEERDKLELIQQIHRLTEQIEVMQAQVQTLQNLASMSRLTVEAVAPELHGHVAAELPAGMQWIDGLSAWSTWISGALDKPVKLPTPEGFVRLDKREYSLQSADGATLRGLSLRNGVTPADGAGI